jgi:hypothetical protein
MQDESTPKRYFAVHGTRGDVHAYDKHATHTLCGRPWWRGALVDNISVEALRRMCPVCLGRLREGA